MEGKGLDTPDTSVVDEEEEAAAALDGCPPPIIWEEEDDPPLTASGRLGVELDLRCPVSGCWTLVCFLLAAVADEVFIAVVTSGS